MGLRLKYSYVTEESVAEEVKEYTFGSDVEFAFSGEDSRYDEGYSFTITTNESLEDAWEQAVNKIIEGLQLSIVNGIKLA